MKPLHRLLPLLAVAVPATADVITPSSATSTSTIGGSRTIAATIDGSGLSSNGGSGDILSETVGGAGSSGHWLSAISAVDDDPNFLSTTEVLTFDLGGTFDVDTVHIWPYIRAEANRGIKNFAISFSTDGGALSRRPWHREPSATSSSGRAAEARPSKAAPSLPKQE